MSFDGRFDGEWTGEWLGGTGEQAGFRSPLPFWHGGGIVKAGFVSPIPIWGLGAVPGAAVTRRKGAGSQPPDNRLRLLREDEEILAVIMAYMETRH